VLSRPDPVYVLVATTRPSDRSPRQGGSSCRRTYSSSDVRRDPRRSRFRGCPRRPRAGRASRRVGDATTARILEPEQAIAHRRIHQRGARPGGLNLGGKKPVAAGGLGLRDVVGADHGDRALGRVSYMNVFPASGGRTEAVIQFAEVASCNVAPWYPRMPVKRFDRAESSGGQRCEQEEAVVPGR
jgi:hypothetical protein